MKLDLECWDGKIEIFNQEEDSINCEIFYIPFH